MGCCKRTLFILGLIVLEAIDLFLDWDFYVEVTNADQESVKDNTPVKMAIFVFAIIGSITFILQLVSIYFDSRNDYKYLTFTSTMSFLGTWIEDIPQIILAVHVAGISTELISNVQIAKAIYAIIEALIHIVISIWQLCCKDWGFRGIKFCQKTLIGLDLVGAVLILLASTFLVVELHEDYLN